MRSFILFKVLDSCFGIDIQRIVSIEKNSVTIPIPQSPSYMMGIVNIRGQVVPVIDSYRLLYNREMQINEETRYILIDVSDFTFALMVESTNEIMNINLDEINPVHMINDDEISFIEGIALVNERLISILDIDKMLITLREMNPVEVKI
ncbi:purine-binding chemotaxis protein CheW [Bacillus sp. BGMRC 2118]|nr:purine-binding chemotaxis protein CheW [Bacillus sp. BGMRC 2118]